MFTKRFLLIKISLIISIVLIELASAEEISSKGSNVEFIIRGTEEHLTFNKTKRIEKWGIVVLDKNLKKTVLYKVIKTATLYDSLYVNEIKKYVSNLHITTDKNAYILDFEQASIPRLEYHPSKIIDYKYLTFSLRPDVVETLELGMVYSLLPIFSLQHHITFSTGLPYSANPSYYVFAFNYGLGGSILRKSHFTLGVWINYHSKILQKTFIGASDFEHKNTFSLEIGGSLWGGKRVFPSTNIRYYFSNPKIKENELKITILLGLNVEI